MSACARLSAIAARSAAALLAATPLVVGGVEGYASWDDFDGATRIDPARWLDSDERISVEGGALRMLKRARGNQTGNGAGGGFVDSFGLQLAPGAAITRLQAKLTVGALEATNCAANPNPSRIFGGLAGRYFNAGSAAPTSGYDDVVAFLRVDRAMDASGTIQVAGGILQCKADCVAATYLGGAALGTATVGEVLTLTLDWDQPNHRFGFTRSGTPTVWATYAVSDARPAFEPWRALDLGMFLANCLAGPRTEGLVDLKFDNVKVNASAVP